MYHVFTRLLPVYCQVDPWTCTTCTECTIESKYMVKKRQNALCLKFAQKCLLVPKLKKRFPRNHQNHDMGKRRVESFQVKRALTERLRRSAIPYMQRLLNENEKKKNDICRQISNFVPVNNDLYCKSASLRH